MRAGSRSCWRMGWYRPVHRKSVPSQEVRALLAARKQMQLIHELQHHRAVLAVEPGRDEGGT